MLLHWFIAVIIVTKSCLTLCNPMVGSTPGFPVLHCLPELAQTHAIESVMPTNHLILCHPLLLLPPIFPRTKVSSDESALHIRWPKYWTFSISPSKEYSGLISFRIDWLDFLTLQGTLKSLLQHHSSKASILWCSAFFFMVQCSYLYMTTGKTIVLTIWTLEPWIPKLLLLGGTLVSVIFKKIEEGFDWPMVQLYPDSTVPSGI